MSHTVGNHLVVEEDFHSEVGASGAHRWRPCSGSINLTRKLRQEGKIQGGGSRAAAEGSAAHLIHETCLQDGDDAASLKDVEVSVGDWTFVVDAEMVAGVQESLDWLRNRISQAEKEGHTVKVYVERTMNSFSDDDVHGKADAIIHIVGQCLIILDFKYGRGITVEPDSDQNHYYGYLAVENYLADDAGPDYPVELWIAQPRIPHPDGTIRGHHTTAGALTQWWFRELLPDIEKTRDPNASLTLGDHCRFCPAKAYCPALKAEVFEFSTEIDPSFMTDEELGEALEKLKVLESLLTSYQGEALRRAKKGHRVPGWKLVRKQSRRAWKEQQPVLNEETGEMEPMTYETAMDRAFGLDCWTEPARLSPAQIEKLPGGNEFAAQWAYQPEAGLTLAAESSKKAEVRPAAEQYFGRHQAV